MLHSDALLVKIQQNHLTLRVEDAFVVPRWFSQQDLWIRQQGISDSAIYNYPVAIRIRGPLDTQALERSVREIRQRHQVLRSVFRILDGELVQIVTQPKALTVPLLDLGSFDWAIRESEARRVALADALQPFDLAHGPLVRTSLMRIAAEDHVLALNTHHLVWDDWSTGIFLRELSLLYRAFTTGQSSPLPRLSFEYADFVRWLSERLQGVELSKRVSFWKEALRDGSDFHHLPTDHPRLARRSYRGACEAVSFDEELVGSLKLLSRRERVSVFMAMLAAFQCLLHRYSGDTDIAVGSCAANRPLVEVEGLIGRFGNDLILRTDLSGNPTFRELLGRVRKTALTAYSYQDLPFGRLVEELQALHDPRRNPLFQVMFILEDAPKEQMQLPGLTLSPYPLDLGTAKYDLNVWLKIQKEIEVTLEYNTDLFEAATMRQILSHYKAVLQEMMADSEGRVSDSRILKKKMPSSIPSSWGTQQQYAKSTDMIQSRLVEIWEGVLGKRHITVTDDFFELGGDSLHAARLFVLIEQSFGRALPLGTLLHAPTIASLATLISEAAPAEPCVVAIQSGTTRPPLFCIHGQSGSVLMYRNLARRLGSDQPVYGVQPQRTVGQAHRATSIEDMATTYVKHIELIQGKGPYFLVGHCMGGTIAFEIAQQLRSRGHDLALLVLLDTYNWSRVRSSWPDTLSFRLQQYWFGLIHFILLGPRGKLQFLRARCEELSSDQSGVLERHRRAALTYVPRAYPGRILHVRPSHQYGRYNRPELGWNDLAPEGLETLYLPIYPGQLFEEPFVRDLAEKLRACIDDVAAEWKPSLELTSEMVPPTTAS